MKLTAIFVLLMAIFAMFASQAEGKVNVNAIKKGGRVIKKGFGIAGAAGTAHEIYEHIRNRKH